MKNLIYSTPNNVIQQLEKKGYRRDFITELIMKKKGHHLSIQCKFGLLGILFSAMCIPISIKWHWCILFVVIGLLFFIICVMAAIVNVLKMPRCSVCNGKLKIERIAVIGGDARRVAVCRRCLLYVDTYISE
jgi:hypothetical protein